MVKKIVFAFSVVATLVGLISTVQSRTLGAEPFPYRVIILNDNLWKISREVKPEEAAVSRNQIMFAILRKNPDAFRGGNINYIKTGVELRMPTLAEAQAEVPEQVNALVKMHKSAWRDGQVSAPGLYELPGVAAATSSRSASPGPTAEATARALNAAPQSPPRPATVPPRASSMESMQHSLPAISQVVPTRQVAPTELMEPVTPPATSSTASLSDSITRGVSPAAVESAPSESLTERGDIDRRISGAMPGALGWLAMGAVVIFACYSFARSRTFTPLQPKRETVRGRPPRRPPAPTIDLASVLPSIQPVSELVVRHGAIGLGEHTADAREVEIKLRIAKAYVDVGRTRAAKEILVEVGRDGRPGPQRVAASQSSRRASYG